jgi:CRISPR/Cas system-associated protein Csx1
MINNYMGDKVNISEKLCGLKKGDEVSVFLKNGVNFNGVISNNEIRTAAGMITVCNEDDITVEYSQIDSIELIKRDREESEDKNKKLLTD